MICVTNVIYVKMNGFSSTKFSKLFNLQTFLQILFSDKYGLQIYSLRWWTRLTVLQNIFIKMMVLLWLDGRNSNNGLRNNNRNNKSIQDDNGEMKFHMTQVAHTNNVLLDPNSDEDCYLTSLKSDVTEFRWTLRNKYCIYILIMNHVTKLNDLYAIMATSRLITYLSE